MSTLAISPEVLATLPPELFEGFVEEAARKDRVTVVKHACLRPKRWRRSIMRRVFNEEGEPFYLTPYLVLKDQGRMLLGLEPIYLAEAWRLLRGDLRSCTPNLRTNAGIDFAADALSKSASRPAAAEYMALTENATAPAAGDTTLTGEIATGGLTRVIATYAHTGGAANYTLSKTFTATSAFTAVQKEAIFNASSAGIMFIENTFTATALSINDQLTVTHTVNI
jgi:hypothetical protein